MRSAKRDKLKEIYSKRLSEADYLKKISWKRLAARDKLKKWGERKNRQQVCDFLKFIGNVYNVARFLTFSKSQVSQLSQ